VSGPASQTGFIVTNKAIHQNNYTDLLPRSIRSPAGRKITDRQAASDKARSIINANTNTIIDCAALPSIHVSHFAILAQFVIAFGFALTDH